MKGVKKERQRKREPGKTNGGEKVGLNKGGQENKEEGGKGRGRRRELSKKEGKRSWR